MSALALNLAEVHEPSVQEIEAARIAARSLSRVNPGAPVRFTVEGQDAAEPISVPAGIFRSIVKMLVEMGNGNAVTVVPVQAELTTSQAADLLNVSRPHLIKLLERNEIPYRMVGTHRKLLAREVLAYRDRTEHARHEALRQMAEIDQELGLYDDNAPLERDDG